MTSNYEQVKDIFKSQGIKVELLLTFFLTRFNKFSQEGVSKDTTSKHSILHDF